MEQKCLILWSGVAFPRGWLLFSEMLSTADLQQPWRSCVQKSSFPKFLSRGTEDCFGVQSQRSPRLAGPWWPDKSPGTAGTWAPWPDWSDGAPQKGLFASSSPTRETRRWYSCINGGGMPQRRCWASSTTLPVFHHFLLEALWTSHLAPLEHQHKPSSRQQAKQDRVRQRGCPPSLHFNAMTG